VSVTNGQAVEAAVVNAAYMSRTSNTSTVGVIDLSKPTGSGAQILDAQQVMNNFIETIGMLDQDDTSLTYATTNYVTNGESLKEAISALDAALAATDASISGVFASNNTWTGDQVFQGSVDYDYSNDNTSGADVLLSVPGKTILRLTNGALESISGIESPAATRLLVIENRTGTAVVLKNDDNVTVDATEIIRTGVNNDITIQHQSAINLFYDVEESEWQVVGGSGSGGGGGGGAGSIQWNAPEGDGAILIEEFGVKSFNFELDAQQKVVALVQVPDSFNPGFQPLLRTVSYANDASAPHAFNIDVYLIRPTVDTLDATTNLETIVTDDLGLGGANVISAVDVALSDVSGEVNGIGINAGDYLRIEISRVDPSITGTTEDVRLIFGSMGVIFA